MAKQNKDKDHNEVTKLFLHFPTYLLGLVLTVGSYLGQNVGISIPPLAVLFSFKTLRLKQTLSVMQFSQMSALLA